MTTDHGITLDEQIRFLAEQSAQWNGDANAWERCHNQPVAAECRERAAMLLTVENTLRALLPAAPTQG